MLPAGGQLDGTFPVHQTGTDIGQKAMVSTVAEHTVVPAICGLKIPDDVPFPAACLLGCGGPTGWGRRSTAPVSPSTT
jgi:S-(hydroxymethyl)glutathione dehydrogenase/alcohol dehydrogenase